MSCIPQRHNDHAEKSGGGCERVEIMCISCSSEIVLSFGKYHVIISWGRYGFPAVSLFVAAFGRCAFGGRLFVFGGRGLGFLAVARVPSIIRTYTYSIISPRTISAFQIRVGDSASLLPCIPRASRAVHPSRDPAVGEHSNSCSSSKSRAIFPVTLRNLSFLKGVWMVALLSPWVWAWARGAGEVLLGCPSGAVGNGGRTAAAKVPSIRRSMSREIQHSVTYIGYSVYVLASCRDKNQNHFCGFRARALARGNSSLVWARALAWGWCAFW